MAKLLQAKLLVLGVYNNNSCDRYNYSWHLCTEEVILFRKWVVKMMSCSIYGVAIFDVIILPSIVCDSNNQDIGAGPEVSVIL